MCGWKNWQPLWMSLLDRLLLALTIQACYADLDQIKIYVLTDKQAKAKNFKTIERNGKSYPLVSMDDERLYRHWAEGKPRDELVVNFEEVSGSIALCLYPRRDDRLRLRSHCYSGRGAALCV